MPRPPRPEKAPANETRGKDQQRVWVLHDGTPMAVPVHIGASDGLWSEVTAGDLQPGTQLLVDVVKPAGPS